jgi:hypothetical protein
MGGYIIRKGGSHSVRQVIIDRQKLDQIADILGIPQGPERDEILSGAESIQIFTGPPTPGSSGTP